jgi:hypothetical protein
MLSSVLIRMQMPLRPVPEGAVRRVEMLAAVSVLHERVTLRDKGKDWRLVARLTQLNSWLFPGDGRVFLKPVDLKLLPVGLPSTFPPSFSCFPCSCGGFLLRHVGCVCRTTAKLSPPQWTCKPSARS